MSLPTSRLEREGGGVLRLPTSFERMEPVMLNWRRTFAPCPGTNWCLTLRCCSFSFVISSLQGVQRSRVRAVLQAEHFLHLAQTLRMHISPWTQVARKACFGRHLTVQI